MDDEQAANLRELAERATPGPWETDADRCDSEFDDPAVYTSYPARESLGRTDNGKQWICQTSYDMQSMSRGNRDYHADARYIAAASPDAILALLDELDRLREVDRRCGKENCFGEDTPGVERWVRATRLEQAQGEIDVLRRERDEAVSANKIAYRAIGVQAQKLGAAMMERDAAMALLREAREFIDTTRDPAYPAGADLADRIDALLGGGGAQ